MIRLVGNDVVDLRDRPSQPKAIHPRWDSRVFTSEELRRLADSPSIHRERWRMWAAKEGAFKVAKKLVPGLPFFPTSFSVELEGAVHATVVHDVGRFDVLLHETPECVHAVSTPEGSPPASSDLATVEGGPNLPSRSSEQVRDLARGALGRVLALDPADIEISTVGGIPVVSSDGTPLPIDLSLSHHGRFVACAWVCSG